MPYSGYISLLVIIFHYCHYWGTHIIAVSFINWFICNDFFIIVRCLRTHIIVHYSLLIFYVTYYCLYLKAKRIVKLVQLLGLLLLLLLLVRFIPAFLSQWSRMTILSKSLSKNLLMNLQGHALLQLRLFLRHLHLHLHHLRLPCGNVALF